MLVFLFHHHEKVFGLKTTPTTIRWKAFIILCKICLPSVLIYKYNQRYSVFLSLPKIVVYIFFQINLLIHIFPHSINEMIRSRSGETAISFLYLPTPPESSASFRNYLWMLKTITDDHRPSLFVHGIRAVTSTTLWQWFSGTIP